MPVALAGCVSFGGGEGFSCSPSGQNLLCALFVTALAEACASALIFRQTRRQGEAVLKVLRAEANEVSRKIRKKLFCADFVQDNLEEATLYRLYCEPTRGRIARNQKEALRTPGISPL